MREVMLCGVPPAPPELEGQPREEAGLGGAHGARARVDAHFVEDVGRRAVPEVCHHVDDVVVHLEGDGVDGLVRDVDAHAELGDGGFFGLEDDVDVGGGVEALVGVHVVVVLDDGLGVARRDAAFREARVAGVADHGAGVAGGVVLHLALLHGGLELRDLALELGDEGVLVGGGHGGAGEGGGGVWRGRGELEGERGRGLEERG
mmetsp:Transcript_8106/g.21228  ORF Transcript_8106/g.21228 Transcript_8106/m.21228 type:complete len:204 (+) Transcript_8106:1349-1960(+)